MNYKTILSIHNSYTNELDQSMYIFPFKGIEKINKYESKTIPYLIAPSSGQGYYQSLQVAVEIADDLEQCL